MKWQKRRTQENRDGKQDKWTKRVDSDRSWLFYGLRGVQGVFVSSKWYLWPVATIFSMMLGGCATMAGKPKNQVISSVDYNNAMEAQGLSHYCGSGNCDTAPVLLYGVAPKYPAAERMAHHPGFVSLIFFVEASGQVSDLRVESATSTTFADAAVDAVRLWKFKPATQNGVPVKIGPMREMIPFRP
jgi:TonB family protein